MSKRFLNNYLYTFAQSSTEARDTSTDAFEKEISLFRKGKELLDRVLRPNKMLYQMAYEFWKLSPEEAAERVDKLVTLIESQEFDLSEAIKIYQNNGFSKSRFFEDADAFFNSRGIPTNFFASLISDLWPLVQSKGAKFNDFRTLLFNAIDRFGFNIKNINDFFINTLKEIQDTLGIYGNSEMVLSLAANYLDNNISLIDLKKFLWQQSVIQYGITGKKPTYLEKDKIDKLSDSVSTLKSEPSDEQYKILAYNLEKGKFIQANIEFFKFMADTWISTSKLTFAKLAGELKDPRQIGFDRILDELISLNNKIIQGIQKTGPASPLTPQTQDRLAPPKIERKSNEFIKFKRFAQQDPQELTNLVNPFLAQINAFDDAVKSLESFVDNEITNIFQKTKNTGVGGIGIFKQDAAYSYLLDTEKALDQADNVKGLINRIIGLGRDQKNTIISNIKKTELSKEKQNNLNVDLASIEKFKNLSLLIINERFKVFEQNLQQKMFSVQIGKTLLKRNNELVELHQNYDRLKSAIKQDNFSAPFLAPRALKIGFKIAKILEELSDEFGNQAEATKNTGNKSLSEALERNRDEFLNAARDARGFVVTDIYPSFANIIGLQATKPEGFSTTFPLSGFSSQASIYVKNKRFADSAKKEVESDLKFRDYWNSLFMQSLDPRPMGDIIEEKPKHGNLTTKEDAKLHKKTMSRFKKTRFKKK